MGYEKDPSVSTRKPVTFVWLPALLINLSIKSDILSVVWKKWIVYLIERWNISETVFKDSIQNKNSFLCEVMRWLNPTLKFRNTE